MTPERKLEYAMRLIDAVDEHGEYVSTKRIRHVLPILDEALTEHGEDLLVQHLQKKARQDETQR